MDSQKSDAEMDRPVEEVEESTEMEEMEDLDEMSDEEEVEVTRDELVTALEEVVRDLSAGLKGEDRDTYMGADDLAQNDWFFAGVSDEEGKYSVTMWPAEGEEDMLRIDIGTEDEVHHLASNREMIEAMTDDFISAMEEDYGEDEEFEEYEEEEDEGEEEEFEEAGEEEEYEEEYEEEMAEEDMTEEDTVSRDGNLPPR